MWRMILKPCVIGFEQLGKDDVESVGGKNASLGEMISGLSQSGVSVPGGFATSVDAYREFLKQDGLADRSNAELAELQCAGEVKAIASGTVEITGAFASPNWYLVNDIFDLFAIKR